MNQNEYVNNQILDADEQELEEAIEIGEFQSVQNLAEEKVYYQQLAQDTLNKTKSITIRLNENDLRKLKAKAIAVGIPYQTFIGSILHQVAKKNSSKG
jgi:predicted DNA binding CopG/RHH family protein